jgi:phage FluMu protein Com
MSIEFRCNQCGKLLRTDDGTVGRQAQCPECGAISTVPEASAASEPSPSPFAHSAGGNPFGAPPAAEVDGPENPYQSPASPAYLPPGQADAFAAQRVSGPATALIVTAILGIIIQVAAIAMNAAQMGMGPMIRQRHNEMFPMMLQGGAGVAGGVIGTVVGIVVLIGAMKMKKLESYSFAMAAAILAIVPCTSPCCWLGLPFGIWALVVLGDGSVKAAFRS